MADTSLGYVTVPTPGTPVRITLNDPGYPERRAAQSILLQALPGNAGIVYVGIGPTFNKTFGTGMKAFLAAPADPNNGPFASVNLSVPVPAAGLNAATYYIDADEANDGVVVSVITG